MSFPYTHLSPSSINKYLECPRAFLYYKSGVEGEQDVRYMVTGSAVHKEIQLMYDPKSKTEPIDEKLVIKARYFDALAGYDMLLVGHPALKPSPQWMPETTISRVFRGVTVLGRIDLMRRDGKKIIDWKTGARNDKDIMQGRIYKWISCWLHELDPKDVDVRLAYLREHPVGYVSVPYTSHAAVESIIGGVIDGISAGRFEGRKGKQCSMCEYRGLCEEWM